MRPVRAARASGRGAVSLLHGEEGARRDRACDLLLVVDRRDRARAPAALRPAGARSTRRALDEGWCVHLHRARRAASGRDRRRRLRARASPLTGSTRLELEAWLGRSPPTSPRDDGFRRLAPALAPAEPEPRGPLGRRCGSLRQRALVADAAPRLAAAEERRRCSTTSRSSASTRAGGRPSSAGASSPPPLRRRRARVAPAMRGQRREILLLLFLAAAPALAYAPALQRRTAARPAARAPRCTCRCASRCSARTPAGELPSWNAAAFSGTPLLAAYRPGALHPLMPALAAPAAARRVPGARAALARAHGPAHLRSTPAGSAPKRAGALLAALSFTLGPTWSRSWATPRRSSPPRRSCSRCSRSRPSSRAGRAGAARPLAGAVACCCSPVRRGRVRRAAVLLGAGRLALAALARRCSGGGRRRGRGTRRSLVARAPGSLARGAARGAAAAADARRPGARPARAGRPRRSPGRALRRPRGPRRPLRLPHAGRDLRARGRAADPAVAPACARRAGARRGAPCSRSRRGASLDGPGRARARARPRARASSPGSRSRCSGALRHEPRGRRAAAARRRRGPVRRGGRSPSRPPSPGPLDPSPGGARRPARARPDPLLRPRASRAAPSSQRAFLLPLARLLPAAALGTREPGRARRPRASSRRARPRARRSTARWVRAARSGRSRSCESRARPADGGRPGLGQPRDLRAAGATSNGYDPLAPASRRAALDGMARRRHRAAASCSRATRAAWSCSACAGCEVPTDALATTPDADGLGDELDVVIEEPRPHLFALPFTRATEVRIVSFLAGATRVEQGRIVAECVARLATAARSGCRSAPASTPPSGPGSGPTSARRCATGRRRSTAASQRARASSAHEYRGVLQLPGRFAVTALRFRGVAWRAAAVAAARRGCTTR